MRNHRVIELAEGPTSTSIHDSHDLIQLSCRSLELSNSAQSLTAAVQRAQVLDAIFPQPIEYPRLGAYRLVRKLGAGGMGEVFAARHSITKQDVALKILPQTSATRLYRFKREFRFLADISHRNLIELYELVVPEGGCAFFTMELLVGVPFAEWVRESALPGELPDLRRLHAAMRQLVAGLHHLHTHDRIHRDLKPSNVLVTSTGRVVILDFGLVSEISNPDGGITQDRQLIGTPAYMAPEQARGLRSGPAADCYALGVMLFECLTGQLPHRGPALTQLLAKQDTTIDPAQAVSGLPGDLRSICIRLLTRRPGDRPATEELLQRFQSNDVRGKPSRTFVGRDRELQALHASFRNSVEGSACTIVHVRGRSGDGKSTLMRRFRDDLRRSGATVLHGRCREQETMPYKGVDALVDTLSAHLRRLSTEERSELRPPELDALTRLFPVLDEIWDSDTRHSPEISKNRKLGGFALRSLIQRMCARSPVVLHIDDFQWADPDSIRLLEYLVQPPGVPAVLLLLSYRSESPGSEALTTLSSTVALMGTNAQTIDLKPLSLPEATLLASRLLGDSGMGASESRAAAIALQSQGSPFFIEQLSLRTNDVGGHDLDLSKIVTQRLSELNPRQLRLLALVAVFGGPMPIGLAFDLIDVDQEVIDSLCELDLLIQEDRSGRADGRRLEATHDRVREAMLARMGVTERTSLHRRVGEWLEERAGGSPAGEEIFGVVDHLVAGFESANCLSTGRRLSLARLGCRAGQRAMTSGAWVAARRYFRVARELADPWRAAAMTGHGEYDLCASIEIGCFQAEEMLEQTSSTVSLTALMRWSLSTDHYCNIVEWYSEVLFLRGKFLECTEFAVGSLSKVGVRISTNPSWVSAIASLVRGWRSIWKIGLEGLSSVPETGERVTRACMAMAAITSGPAVTYNPALQVKLMGLHACMLARHGMHERAELGLAGLAWSAVAVGNWKKAREVVDFIDRSLELRPVPTTSYFLTQTVLLSAKSSLLPIHEVAAMCKEVLERAHDVAPRPLVEFQSLVCLYVFHLSGEPLCSIRDIVSRLTGRSQGYAFHFAERLMSEIASQVEALRGGPGDLDLSGPVDTSLPEIVQCWVIVTRLKIALLLGQRDLAWEILGMFHPRYYRRRYPFWFGPVAAALGTILMADRYDGSGTRERLRIRRAIKRNKRSVMKCLDGSSSNYRPLLDIIDGEIAAVHDKYDAAVSAYERARVLALEHEMTWIAGLASERLAEFARRRGHTIFADTAYHAAQESYGAWGATAVVTRLERTRTEMHAVGRSPPTARPPPHSPPPPP